MLYIHIPYCASKCIYCDFYSGGNPDWNAIAASLCHELSSRLAAERHGLPETLRSVYIGGGTPSLMPPRLFGQFMGNVRRILAAAGLGVADDAEITVEVNPEDVDTARIAAWKGSGVNRVSMGVQSLDDAELRMLRRRHTASRALEAATLLRRNFDNLSLDIIYGLPGQTDATLRDTLGKTIALEPDHVSVYSLMYEEGTPLTLLRDSGRIAPLPDDICVEMSHIVSSSLQDAGYERYEISNYARPGYRSRHNSGYWSGRPYLGIGPSACSFDGVATRRNNHADLKGYLARYVGAAAVRPDSGGEALPPFYDEERLSPAERREEVVFTQLRRREGIDLAAFSRLFGYAERQRMSESAQKWIRSGMLRMDSSALALTERGIMVSDSIILDLI